MRHADSDSSPTADQHPAAEHHAAADRSLYHTPQQQLERPHAAVTASLVSETPASKYSTPAAPQAPRAPVEEPAVIERNSVKAKIGEFSSMTNEVSSSSAGRTGIESFE